MCHTWSHHVLSPLKHYPGYEDHRHLNSDSLLQCCKIKDWFNCWLIVVNVVSDDYKLKYTHYPKQQPLPQEIQSFALYRHVLLPHPAIDIDIE